MRERIAGVLALLLIITGVTAPDLTAQHRYRPVKVQNGGTVHGVVRLHGAAPSPLRLVISKDEKICGKEQASPRLLLGRERGVANAIVSLEGIKEGKAWSRDVKPVLDQKLCSYEPHVLIVPAGSDLEIVNNDPILHNVHAYELTGAERSLFNIAQPIKGQRTPVRSALLNNAGLIQATCDAGHPWMSAYIMVADHPYYEVTDRDGGFTIADVPPGTYRLRMWHEGVAVVKTEKEQGIVKKYFFEPPYSLEQEVVILPDGEVSVEFDLVLR